MNWDNVKIVGRSDRLHTIVFLETSHTKSNLHCINRCVDIPTIYENVVKDLIKWIYKKKHFNI